MHDDLFRGCDTIIIRDEIEKKLKTQEKPLRLKAGFDPTAADLHLGHTVVLQKLRQWQNAGHIVSFVIGDFTALIGDPTGRNQIRPELDSDAIQVNSQTYQAQVFSILNPEQTEVVYNSSWLNKLSALNLLQLCRLQTIARLLERDDFAKRYAEQQPIAMHELMYPLLQGYDSVALRSDIEFGGSDQLFNLLMGRELQKHHGQDLQSVITMPLLEGTDGIRKMSKSYGNYIGLHESPEQQYGKLMSISDNLMWRYLLLLSDRSLETIQQQQHEVATGQQHPKTVKMDLAFEIVKRYHGHAAADAAAHDFHQKFAASTRPEKLPDYLLTISSAEIAVAWIMKELTWTKSLSEGRRLIAQQAVSVDGIRLLDPMVNLDVGADYIINCGKRRWARVSLQLVEES